MDSMVKGDINRGCPPQRVLEVTQKKLMPESSLQFTSCYSITVNIFLFFTSSIDISKECYFVFSNYPWKWNSIN